MSEQKHNSQARFSGPQTLNDLALIIESLIGPDLKTCHIVYNELTLEVYAGSIVRILTILRDNQRCQFKQLIDICGVDYPDHSQRFEIIYHLLSLTHNHRLRVMVLTDGETPIPSVCEVFKSANWWEREVWDLYGVPFSDHPDLRRILTDYHFDGHPMRKDFPLTGYLEVRYDETQKRVVYEPISLPQEFRTFDFLSPWEGILKPNPEVSKVPSLLSDKETNHD